MTDMNICVPGSQIDARSGGLQMRMLLTIPISFYYLRGLFLENSRIQTSRAPDIPSEDTQNVKTHDLPVNLRISLEPARSSEQRAKRH